MKIVFLGFLFALSTVTCFGQSGEPLCPRHIETPDYPAILRVANISGKVSLTLTIDADGSVIDVKAKTETNVPGNPLLERGAVSNIRRWTFAKPPSAPYIETIVYDYQVDKTGSTRGTEVTFDLPSHVTIIGEMPTLNTSESNKPK